MRVPRIAWVALALFGLVVLGLMVTQVVLLENQLRTVREQRRIVSEQRAIAMRQEQRSRPVVLNARPLIAQARAAAPAAALLGRQAGTLLGHLTPLAADLRAVGAAEVLRGVSLLVDAVLRAELPARAGRASDDVAHMRADVSRTTVDVRHIRRLQRDAVDIISAMLGLQREVASGTLRRMLQLQREVVAHQRELVAMQRTALEIQRQTLALARSSLAVQQSTETHTASLDAKTGGPITPPAPVTPPPQSAGG
jgi:hypothetical protein